MSPESPPERRARILNAAARLINHYGYDKTTVDDIAREARVSKGAVYLHWSSKEALFDDLLITEMQRALADFWTRVQADPQGGLIGRLYAHSVDAMQANPLVRALYTQESRILGDFVHRHGPERYTQRFLFGQDFVRLMQSAGLVRTDLSAESIAYLMAVIAFGFLGVESIIPADQAPPLPLVSASLAAVAQGAFGPPGEQGGDSEAGKQAMAVLLKQVQEQYKAGEES